MNVTRGNLTCLTLIIWLYLKWLLSAAFLILLHDKICFHTFWDDCYTISSLLKSPRVCPHFSLLMTFLLILLKNRNIQKKVLHLPTTRSTNLHASLYIYMCVDVCTHTHTHILHPLLSLSLLSIASPTTYITSVLLLTYHSYQHINLFQYLLS